MRKPAYNLITISFLLCLFSIAQADLNLQNSKGDFPDSLWNVDLLFYDYPGSKHSGGFKEPNLSSRDAMYYTNRHFQIVYALTDEDWGPVPLSILSYDADHDNLLELYCLIENIGLGIFETDGNDNFTYHTSSIGLGKALVIGDIDGDGKADYIKQNGNYTRVYESPDFSSFPSVNVWTSSNPVPTAERFCSITDMDQDGKNEILTLTGNWSSSGPAPGYIDIYETRGDNNYELVAEYLVCDYSSPINPLSPPSVADFDGDGKIEFAFGNEHVPSPEGKSVIHIWENIGDDQYSEVFTCDVDAKWVFHTAVGNDLDEDGKPEFIAMGYNPGESYKVYIFESDGDNQYSIHWQFTFGYPDPNSCPRTRWYFSVSTGDVDADGKDEIVVYGNNNKDYEQIDTLFVLKAISDDNYSCVKRVPENRSFHGNNFFGGFLDIFDTNKNGYGEIVIFNIYTDSTRTWEGLELICSTDSLATANNNGEKMIKIGTTDEFWFVYENRGRIYASNTPDKGTFWERTCPSNNLTNNGFPALSSYTDAFNEEILAAIWVNNNVMQFSRHSDISGWSDPWHLIIWAGTKMHYSPPSLIIDDTGIGHFAWEVITEPDVYPGNITYQLHYSTFDAGLDQPNIIEDEILDEAEEYVDEWTEGLELGCASVDIDNDNSVVVWSRPLGEGKNTIYFKFKQEGGGWSAEPEVVSVPEEVSIHPFCDIVYGKLHVVWEDEGIIKYRQRLFEGWLSIETVSDPYNYSRSPQILDGDICVYTEVPQFQPNHHSDVVYSERTGLGNWSSPNIIESTSSYSEYPQSYVYESTPSMRILNTIWTEGDAPPYEVRFASVELFGSPLIIISGNVFESDSSTPVLDPIVTIANLNTEAEWTATVEPGTNSYSLELSGAEIPSVGDDLRITAKKALDEGIYDPDGYTYSINITNHVVTATDISENGFTENLNLDHYCINYYPDYPYHIKEQDEYSGAAVMQMWVDFKEEGPYTQDSLHTWGLENNTEEDQTAGLEHVDPQGMALTLKDIIDLPPGHTFTVGVMPGDENGLNWAMHRICWWQYTGPGALPTGVNYENWMSVRGIHTDKRPQDGIYAGPGDWEYGVYGFWINDPTGSPPTGLGANSYKTADEWTSLYYTTITDPNNPQWDGKYITVLEPPEYDAQIHIASPVPRFNEHQINALSAITDRSVIQGDMKSWIIQAAIRGVTEELIPYDENFKAVFEKTHPGDPFFVTSIDGDDYYAVPFIPDKPTLNPKAKIALEIKVDVVTKNKSNSDIKSTAQTTSILNSRNGKVEEKIMALEDLILTESRQRIAVVILINAQDGSFREASWTDTPVEYLPILREQAQQIAFDTAEEMGLEVGDINDLRPELIHRQASPYYPEWLVIIGEYAIYITQNGDVSVEPWFGGTVNNGGTMSQDGSASLTYGLTTALPTPFIKSTMISYSIARPGHVSLNIYDVTGRLVRTLVNAKMDAGFYTLTWRGYDNNDQKLAHGIYFTRLKSGDFVSVKKVILVK